MISFKNPILFAPMLLSLNACNDSSSTSPQAAPKPTRPPTVLVEEFIISEAANSKFNINKMSSIVFNGRQIDDIVMTKQAYRSPYFKAYKLNAKNSTETTSATKGAVLYDLQPFAFPEIATYRGYSATHPNIMFYGAVFSDGIFELHAIEADQDGNFVVSKQNWFIPLVDRVSVGQTVKNANPIMLEYIDNKDYEIAPDRAKNQVVRGMSEQLGKHNYLYRMQYIDHQSDKNRPSQVTDQYLRDRITATEMQALWQTLIYGSKTGLRFDVSEYYWHSGNFTWDWESSVGSGYVEPDYAPYFDGKRSHNMQYLTYDKTDGTGACWANGGWAACSLAARPSSYTAHEIGHNFGIGHKEPSDAYKHIMSGINLGTMQARAVNVRINDGKLMPPTKAESFPTPPSAFKDFATTYINQVVTISPLKNDFDINGDSLKLSDAKLIEGKGKLTWNEAIGTLTFAPAQDWQGQAKVRYTTAESNNNYGQTGSNLVVINVIKPGLAARYHFDQLAFDSDKDGDLNESEMTDAFDGEYESRFKYVLRRFQDRSGNENHLYQYPMTWGSYVEPRKIIGNQPFNPKDYFSDDAVKGRSVQFEMQLDNTVAPRWACDLNFDNDFSNDNNACTENQISTLDLKPLPEHGENELFNLNAFNPGSKNFAFSGWFKCGDDNCVNGQTLLASKMYHEVVDPSRHDRNYGGWQIYLDNGQIKSSIASRDVTAYDNVLSLASGVQINDGRWHHIVMNIDRTHSSYELWVDNVKTAQLPIPSTFGEIIAIRSKFNSRSYVGGADAIIGGHLSRFEKEGKKFQPIIRPNNYVDEVEVHHSALSPQAIQTLYLQKG
ncbi:cadherin-like domain-containing protein [Vibrio atypicus]|uniref:cadherin-like domain-containing protein n=1 Tax=Vibrio atypicus TaxID=558271 RepID=UPI0013576AA5|nr:cadherin-like domain-containing protein [Vibrio atypicus]